MNGKRFSEEKTRRTGFYLALAVCLVAVGVAAWSTFDAVNGTLEMGEGSSSTASAPASEDTEGSSLATPRPQRETATPAPTPRATPSTQGDGEPDDPQGEAPAQETAAQAQQEEPAESSQAQPATAPLYERSQEMVWPVEGEQVQLAYSAGAPVYSQTMKDWRIHTGLDVAADSEAPVVACANGQVKETYSDSMLGNVALIEHGDYLFYYCGLGENFLVQPGDVVSAGQQIGVVTAVPFEAAEDPHLHLEVRRDGVALDPQAVLTGEA